MKTALVHDWLISQGGAEKVLFALHELFPSPIYTLFAKEKDSGVKASFLQHFPKRYYRSYLPLYPRAVESFDLSEYDLILSSSHAVAKGVLKREDQRHICYCHTPMRYAWDLMEAYLSDYGRLKSYFAKKMLQRLRRWDFESSKRVDHFVANSHFVAARIEKNYGRKAKVIYPPVNVKQIPFQEKKDSFYLTASRLVPYKRIDLIVKTFSQMPEKKLVVIGEGPEEEKLKKMAGSNIEFLGRVEDEILYDYLGKARAFVFAALEDFGILPLEAQAAGTPVIAYGEGGALETVSSGLFFEKQTSASLFAAIKSFESQEFDPKKAREHAEQFSKERFQKEFQSFVREVCS